MVKKHAFNQSIGKEYGKPDIERLGIFAESSYMNGKGYVNIYGKPNYLKGAPFLTDGPKTKCGTTHGYFDDEYRRIFEGEAIPQQKKRSEKPPDTVIPFLVGATTKKHSTPGDAYGTFQGTVEAFSRITRPEIKRKSPLNFVTRNPKKGGPGFVNICINTYPQHEPDPYLRKDPKQRPNYTLAGPMVTTIYPKAYFTQNPFKDEKATRGPIYVSPKVRGRIFPVLAGDWIPNGPPKWQGGCHAGCFDTFPEFKKCRYTSITQANKPFISDKGPVWTPIPIAKKTMFTESVLYKNTDLKVNTTNYKTYVPNYTKNLLE